MIKNWFSNKNRFISWDEKLMRERMRYNTYTPNTNKINVVTGLACVLYGVVTILLPTGSLWAISLGMFLIACPISIKALLKGFWADIKFYVGIQW